MGRKSSKGSYTSKGQRRNVSKWIRKAMKRDRTPMQELNFKSAAWSKGKKVMVTVPSKLESKKPFIRVPAEEVWKRYEPFRMKERS